MTSPLVLVAGDSASVRGVVAHQLRRNGCVVLEAEAAEAVDQARRHLPNVVVVDLTGGDGIGALLALHRDESLRDLPVVVLTERTDPEHVRMGAHDELRVPFETADLLARVGAAARTGALWAELRQRNDDLERFARLVGHDLKSPLTVVAGMAQTLGARWESLEAPDRTRLLDRIAGAARRAAQMVTDLVRLARATGVSPDPAAVADADVVALGVVKEAGLEADTTLAGTWLPVRIDPAVLAVVLGELVVNADRYGRCADGRLELSITGEPGPEGLHIVVEDHGRGIDEPDAPQVFAPFLRPAASANAYPEASGVGLALVRRIVERWSGTVSLGLARPTGASFRIVLPTAAEQRPGAPQR